jgi:diguanylate cyclase (GGDEF)-like protein/PAS domain S-box-containing protein
MNLLNALSSPAGTDVAAVFFALGGWLAVGILLIICFSRRRDARLTAALKHAHEAQQKLTGEVSARQAAEFIHKSEHFLKFITDAVPVLLAYWDTDLRCKFANRAYLQWWGKSADEIDALTLRELMGESLFAVNEAHIRGALAGDVQHFERFLSKPDGTVAYVLAEYLPHTDASGQVQGFIIVFTDIKALQLAQAELRLAASVYQHTSEGIMLTDANGVILSVNPAFTQITGYLAQEAVGQTPRLLRSHRHDQEFHASVWRQISEQGFWQGELWNRRKNGDVFLEWQTITRIAGADDASLRYLSVFHDITDVWQTNEDNRYLAFHDALTRLPNRALLMERLERRVAMAERDPRGIAVMFLDLDRFKLVNDGLGHAIGDELLVLVAHKLQTLVRQNDTVARFGGDEFIVKLDNPASEEEVVGIAERIIAIINEPHEIQGHRVQVGTSIGIAMFPGNGKTAAELIKNADTAMYEAKHAGRNTWRFFKAK